MLGAGRLPVTEAGVGADSKDVVVFTQRKLVVANSITDPSDKASALQDLATKWAQAAAGS